MDLFFIFVIISSANYVKIALRKDNGSSNFGLNFVENIEFFHFEMNQESLKGPKVLLTTFGRKTSKRLLTSSQWSPATLYKT